MGLLALACTRPGEEPAPSSRSATTGEPEQVEQAPENVPAYVGEWTLRELEGKPIAEGLPRPTMSFRADGSFVASTGVNRMSGRPEISWDRKLQIGGFESGEMTTTRRAGEPAAMELEKAFTRALGQASSLRVVGETMSLLDGDRRTVLLFTRRPRE